MGWGINLASAEFIIRRRISNRGRFNNSARVLEVLDTA